MLRKQCKPQGPVGFLLESIHLQVVGMDLNYAVHQWNQPQIMINEAPYQHLSMLTRQMCTRNRTRCSAGKRYETEDLIEIDDNAVYLLPSAYVTERKFGVETRWTPELFSTEILALRQKVFRMFSSEKMDGVWDGLSSWYAHTSHVWETLMKFGHNLLHYKTILEIEARKDLYELAKNTTKELMEQGDGFRAQCSQTLKMFKNRLDENASYNVNAHNFNDSNKANALARPSAA